MLIYTNACFQVDAEPEAVESLVKEPEPVESLVESSPVEEVTEQATLESPVEEPVSYTHLTLPTKA